MLRRLLDTALGRRLSISPMPLLVGNSPTSAHEISASSPISNVWPVAISQSASSKRRSAQAHSVTMRPIPIRCASDKGLTYFSLATAPLLRLSVSDIDGRDGDVFQRGNNSAQLPYNVDRQAKRSDRARDLDRAPNGFGLHSSPSYARGHGHRPALAVKQAPLPSARIALCGLIRTRTLSTR